MWTSKEWKRLRQSRFRWTVKLSRHRRKKGTSGADGKKSNQARMVINMLQDSF